MRSARRGSEDMFSSIGGSTSSRKRMSLFHSGSRMLHTTQTYLMVLATQVAFVRLIPTDFIGTHSLSYLSDYTSSFFSRSVKSLSPSYSSEHRVTVYAIHNPQPNQVSHWPRFPGYPPSLRLRSRSGRSLATANRVPRARQVFEPIRTVTTARRPPSSDPIAAAILRAHRRRAHTGATGGSAQNRSGQYCAA